MGEKIDASYALHYARKLGASYADLRINRRRAEKTELLDGITPCSSYSKTAGLGIRVLVNGSWGFSSIPLNSDIGRQRLKGIVTEAVELAKISAGLRHSKVALAPLKGFSAGTVKSLSHGSTPYHALSPKERLRVLWHWDSAMAGRYISTRTLSIETESSEFYFAQVEQGEFREIFQNRRGCEIFLSVTAVGHGEVQTRSRNICGTEGFPFPLTEEIHKLCKRFKKEAVGLLSAPECKQEVCDVIIMPDQFGLHTHETVHGMEGDRTSPLDFEATYMGGALMSDPRLLTKNGEIQIASKHVTLMSDPTLAGAYGRFDYDDDGSLAERFPLIENGVFQNFLLSRETAGELYKTTGDKSWLRSPAISCSRASDSSRMPLVRMSCTQLVPGETTLQEMISGIRHGLVIATPYSWSMYPSRQGFIFGCELALSIQNGRLEGLVRNPAYHGSTVPFWKSIAVVGSEEYNYNQGDCGKGQPGQRIGTGHFSPPVLALGVNVFSRRRFRNGKRGGEKCSLG